MADVKAFQAQDKSKGFSKRKSMYQLIWSLCLVSLTLDQINQI